MDWFKANQLSLNLGKMVFIKLWPGKRAFKINSEDLELISIKSTKLGTLTSPEQDTLKQLVVTRLTTSSKPATYRPWASASTGNSADIDRVQSELKVKTEPPAKAQVDKLQQKSVVVLDKLSEKKYDDVNKRTAAKQPVLKLKRLSEDDIRKYQKKSKTIPKEKPKGKDAGKPKVHTFAVSTQKLKKYKCKYTLKCAIANCSAKFNTVKEWNSHHVLNHRRSNFSCDKCGQTQRTLSSFRDHQYMHKSKNSLWQV